MSGLDIEGVLAGHRLATGPDGIPSDGEWAWLRCSCGFAQNVATPDDDLSVAEEAWEAHVAAVLREQIAAWLGSETARQAAYDAAFSANHVDLEAALAALAAPPAPSRVPGEET